ncbi:hypothetical protein HMPREF6485_2292 [Segatella buccae ATCC 33574]|uniref:Uncharacterized protein n=1 Tax=Segatella buccae ATCC 33574 TaxID=873513 RepID=E6K9M8_9BACT|nr:hypothetical protein HMPREF6485_2292 [Segatella buccae ATCC 33574]
MPLRQSYKFLTTFRRHSKENIDIIKYNREFMEIYTFLSVNK